MRDDKSCNHDPPSAIREAEKAAQQSTGHDAVDLTLDDSPSPSLSPPKQDRGQENGEQVIDLVSDEEDAREELGKGAVFPPALADTEASAQRVTPAASPDKKVIKATPPSADRNTVNERPLGNAQRKAAPPSNPYLHADGSWSCPICTLNNSGSATRCEACDGLKPIDESVGWRCEFCYEYGSEHGFWMCRNCGAIRKQ